MAEVLLVNKNQDRFMENYHPLLDLAPRDIVARAIVQESEPALNIAPLMTQIEFRFPTIFQQLLNRGFTTDQYLIQFNHWHIIQLVGLLLIWLGKHLFLVCMQ